MHPIERIRALARASWLDPQTIATEAADAIADAIRWMDEAVAVSIARRLLAWHPYCAPLWWVCGRVLGSVDPLAEAEAVCAALIDDATALATDVALPPGSQPLIVGPSRVLDEIAHTGGARSIDEASHLLVGASALGAEGVLTYHPAAVLVQEARRQEVPVWAVAGVGCVVDQRLSRRLEGLLAASFARPESRVVNTSWWEADSSGGPNWTAVPLGEFDWVCGPDGLEYPVDALARAFACPTDLIDAAGTEAF